VVSFNNADEFKSRLLTELMREKVRMLLFKPIHQKGFNYNRNYEKVGRIRVSVIWSHIYRRMRGVFLALNVNFYGNVSILKAALM